MEENVKKIIVYFSYTGNTKMIAERIKRKLHCDILEIIPVQAYSEDYDLVVKEEQNNSSSNKMPEIEQIDTDLSKYDEIILGTPVWWYTLAPVIRTFLYQYDLSHKKIIPYATNAGWLGHTFEEIKKLCPNSRIEKGMNIVFDAEAERMQQLITPVDEIDAWIDSLK